MDVLHISPPLLAASTASEGRPNWFMRGPSWPEARALLNILIDCTDRDKQHVYIKAEYMDKPKIPTNYI